jgi:hypothetical protein
MAQWPRITCTEDKAMRDYCARGSGAGLILSAIITRIKVARLQLARHLQVMGNNEIHTRIVGFRHEKRRTAGRIKLQWMHGTNIVEYMRKFGIQGGGWLPGTDRRRRTLYGKPRLIVRYWWSWRRLRWYWWYLHTPTCLHGLHRDTFIVEEVLFTFSIYVRTF